MTNAVLYARVSGDDRQQEGRNLLGQLAMCHAYAEERGYQVIAELHEDDRGASGAAFELPQLNLVREMAQRGEFTVLITRELDRLSRSLAKQLFVEEELRRCSVQIEYVLGAYADTPEGSLMKNVRASVAEYERLKISERMVRGRELKVKAGSVLVYGRPPYGYTVAEQDKKWVLVINEDEASVVRSIFEWYTVGDGSGRPLTMQAIQAKLTGMAVPTYADKSEYNFGKKRGFGEWSKTQVERILGSETYAGTWYWRKNKKTQDGHRVSHPVEEHVSVSVPALVSRETWDMIQQRRKENSANATRNLKRQYLMRCRLTCGHCGATMSAYGTVNHEGRSYEYYRCAAAADKKHTHYVRVCSAPNFRTDAADQLVWQWLQVLLTDSTALQAGLDALEAEQEAMRAPALVRLQEIEGQLAEQRQQLERLLDAYQTGLFPKQLVEERRSKLARRVSELEGQQADLHARLTRQDLTPEQARDLRDFAAKIGSRLAQSQETYELQRFIVETLDVRASLAVEEGQKVAHVTCVLGADSLSIEIPPTRTNSRHQPVARRRGFR